MRNDDQEPVRYQFSSPVDVLARFDHLGIEHVEISNERTIVIYQRTIFDFVALVGHLDSAQAVEVKVFDISPDLNADTDLVPLIERLIHTLATNADVDWER